MGGIFISYRREDSAPYARLLGDSLAAIFGPEQIFRDIDTIGPGVDFPEAIADAVGSCKVLLAVINTNWLTVQRDGQRRLDDPADYVRLEIAAALDRDVLVVPVLIEQTKMPGRAELPPALAELADRNAVRLTDDGWHDGVRRLANALEGPLGVPAGVSPGGPRLAPPPSGWTSGSHAPSSWTKDPLPEPTSRRKAAPVAAPSEGEGGGGGGGRKRTGLLVGVLVAVAAVVGIGFAVAGGGDDDGGGRSPVTARPSASTTATTRPGGTTTTRRFFPLPSLVTQPGFDPGLIIVSPSVKAEPSTGPAGANVTFTGTGFGADERVQVRFRNILMGEAKADAKGAFEFTFKIPGATPDGTFEIVATGTDGDRSAKASFRVT